MPLSVIFSRMRGYGSSQGYGSSRRTKLAPVHPIGTSHRRVVGNRDGEGLEQASHDGERVAFDAKIFQDQTKFEFEITALF